MSVPLYVALIPDPNSIQHPSSLGRLIPWVHPPGPPIFRRRSVPLEKRGKFTRSEASCSEPLSVSTVRNKKARMAGVGEFGRRALRSGFFRR